MFRHHQVKIRVSWRGRFLYR